MKTKEKNKSHAEITSSDKQRGNSTDDTLRGIFDVTDLEKEIEEGEKEEGSQYDQLMALEGMENLLGKKKSKYIYHLSEMGNLRVILEERQRLGDIVKRDWIEKAEVEKILNEEENEIKKNLYNSYGKRADEMFEHPEDRTMVAQCNTLFRLRRIRNKLGLGK